MSPDALLQKFGHTHPPTLMAAATALRCIALASGPGTTEEVKYGGILFAGSQPFCGIFIYAAHVTLEFSDGASLPDPETSLQGKGKGRRHLKFTTPDPEALARATHFIALARKASDTA